MRRFLTAIAVAFLCGSIAQAGFITSSGAGAFARNNDNSISPGSDRKDVSMATELGYMFTSTSPIIVNQLGIWDGPNSGGTINSSTVGDGLEAASTITIWDSAGVIALAQATIPAGIVGGADEFAYIAISPVTLGAGQYIISASYDAGGNAFYNGGSTVAGSNGGTAAVTSMTGITINGNRYNDATTSGFQIDAGAPDGSGFIEAYVGPSAQFSAVPEPSSFLFLGLVATSAFAWKRRQNLVALEAE